MRLNSPLTMPQGELDIVTMGELLIDLISTEYVENLKDAGNFQRSFGGSPGNIASNLAQMKCRTAIIASVGQDEFGQYLISFLEEKAVEVLGINQLPAPTTIVFVSKSMENPTFLPIRGADKELELKQDHFQLVEKTKVFHFSAWALSHSKTRRSTMELVHYARKLGKCITFDPNYRKILWEEGQDGPGFILEEVLPLVDIVKPSESDAEHLFGKMPMNSCLKHFHRKKEQLVILSLGSEGICAFDGKSQVHIPSFARKVVDTTGAGDAFWAGFLKGLLLQKTIEEALYEGSYSAAYKVGSLGAVGTMPASGDLKRWAEKQQKNT